MVGNRISKRGILLLVLLYLANSYSAQEASYESAATGRIVGDTPQEILDQLNADGDIDLKHSTYRSVESNLWEFSGYGAISRSGWVQHTLEAKFPGENDVVLGFNSWPSSWNQWDTNELFVAEPASGRVGEVCFGEHSCTSSGDLSWGSDFEEHSPLFLLDADYGGLYLPRQYENGKSFVGAFSQDSTMIAPTNVPSREFVQFFVCNLAFSTIERSPIKFAEGNNLGWIYTNSRNAYHWNSLQPAVPPLLSYSLYGLPYRKVYAPVTGLSSDSSVYDYCSQTLSLVGRDTINSGYSYMDTHLFDTGEINVTSVGNYSLITTPNTYLGFRYRRMVLPEKTVLIKYPLETVIKNVTLLNFTDSADFVVSDLPVWEGDFANRTMYNGSCYPYNRYPGISFSRAYAKDSQILSINIRPVEVLDCENGSFRVYRNITYGIIYETYSPVFLDVLGYPGEAVSGENVTVSVRVDNLINESASGLLFLDSNGSRIFEENISIGSANSSYYNISFNMLPGEGFHGFVLGFFQVNETKTNTSFVIRTDSLGVSLESQQFLYESMDLDVSVGVVNGWNKTLDAKREVYLSKVNESGLTVLRDDRVNIPPNESTVVFDGLYRPLPGDYYVSLKVSTEISPEGERVSRPLHVESLGGVCSDQGNVSVNAGSLNYSRQSYCKGNTIVVLINLTNPGSVNESTQVNYSSSLIETVRDLSVFEVSPASDPYGAGNQAVFNTTVPANATQSAVLAIELNEGPEILSANHSPGLAGGYSEVLFTVNWSDLEGDWSRLFVCNSSGLNESGCLDGQWCNTSFSYDKPLECEYLVYPLDDGVNEYFVYVCDGFGACSESYNSSFEVDAHAPNITLHEPANQSQLPANTTSVWVNISTSENASCRYNLSDPEFYFETDGVNFSQTGGLDHGFGYNVTNGQSYGFYYKCRDTAGNVNEIGIYHGFSVQAENCSSGGVGICGSSFCCGADDGVCPTDFDGVSCNVSDPDCGASNCSYGGVAVCGDSFCCGADDGVCPSDFDGVSCGVSDPDCSCSFGGVGVCGVSFCCGVGDGVCPSDFQGVSCSTSDVDCS